MYDCGGYFKSPADSDSLAVDSLGVEIDAEAVVDEYGNVIIPSQEPDDAKQTPMTEQPQVAEEPKEQ